MTVTLTATEYGEGGPVAILHGLFGAGRNWASIAQRLAARHRVVAFDLRNHGASPWADTMSYPEMAEDVRAAMLARGHRRFALIGHSMGGKAAMTLTLGHPDAVARLVVVDIAPVTRPIPFLPYIRAMRGIDLAAITRRREADEQLAAVVKDPAERAFLLQNLVFNDDAPRWQLNLPAIEAVLPVLAGFPTPTGAAYAGPALFIAGERSSLVQPEDEPAITALFPNAAIVRVKNAGHWVHAEQPAAFLALVEPFLSDES